MSKAQLKTSILRLCRKFLWKLDVEGNSDFHGAIKLALNMLDAKNTYFSQIDPLAVGLLFFLKKTEIYDTSKLYRLNHISKLKGHQNSKFYDDVKGILKISMREQ